MIGNIKQIGLKVLERLRVQYDRTVTSKGFKQPNGLGFQATERLHQRVSVTRTINNV